jgi:hypothetical protein
LLRDGSELSSSELYRIAFHLSKDSWVYIFQIDSTGKMDWLFPKNPYARFSSGQNPVEPNRWVFLPGRSQEDWFRLDENSGVEHIYSAANTSWTALEDALVSAMREPHSSKKIASSFGLRTRGIHSNKYAPFLGEISQKNIHPHDILSLIDGEKGVLVVEKWFNHVLADSCPGSHRGRWIAWRVGSGRSGNARDRAVSWPG